MSGQQNVGQNLTLLFASKFFEKVGIQTFGNDSNK